MCCIAATKLRNLIIHAWGWCTGTTQRDGMEREEEEGLFFKKRKKEKDSIHSLKLLTLKGHKIAKEKLQFASVPSFHM